MQMTDSFVAMLSPYVISPKDSNEEVENILDELDTGYDQMQVTVNLWHHAKPLDCFENVRKKIKKDGGAVQNGWLICKTEIVYEANAHAVWISPAGRYIDITPKQGWSSSTVMFVPDDNLNWEGHPIPNRRWDHTGKDTVQLLVETLNFYDQIRSLTRFEDGSDVIHYPSESVRLMEVKYEVLLMAFKMHVAMEFPDQAPCPCAVGRPFGDCHKATLRDQIAADRAALNL